ncbi:hypothetical protein ACH42_02465 [Endozoicomonas sp. (ex Bugula neritina AB1)]|nr:hypothetical protein ACH42_02465 [Endozoicomonas sp. (ex Bugula neritina AB1)]
MFRKILVTLFALPFVLMGGLLGVSVLMVSFEPFTPEQSYSSDSYKRADQWFSHIRSAFDNDKLHRITLSSGDITDVLFYASTRLKLGDKKLMTLVGGRTDFEDHKVITRFTLKPNIEYPIFLNVSLSFSEDGEGARWDFLEVGNSYWPGDVIGWLVNHLLLPNLPESKATFWQSVTGAVEGFSILPDRVSLVYRTNEALRKQLKSQASALMVSSPEERQVLQLYLDVMAASAALQDGTEISLSKVLVTLFGLAKARSDQGRAVEENERLLRAMAVQVADLPVRALLAPGVNPVILDRPIVLRGRADLTQHFLVSAALALELDEETALNIGVSKEQADSEDGGTGFSMSDLVADMAGIRFAVVATESETAAKKLQELMLSQQGEHTFMPRINWLPPGLSAQAYDDLIRHPTYPVMMDKIEQRLNALPVQTDI